MLIIITKWRNNKSNNLYSKLCVFAMKYCSLKTTNTAYIYLCINTTKGIALLNTQYSVMLVLESNHVTKYTILKF